MANNYRGGNQQTSNSRFLRLLQANNRNVNNGTTTGGIAHALNMAMQGYSSGVDQNQETASNEAMSKAAALMQGTNPRVLAAPSVASNLGDDEDETLGQGITIPGVAPDMQGAISVLSNNSKYAPLAMQLQMGENAKKEAAALLREQRAYDKSLIGPKHSRDLEKIQARENLPTKEQKIYRARVAAGYGGSLSDHLKEKSLFSQGFNYTPGLGGGAPTITAMPGGPGDIAQRRVKAQAIRNDLLQERISQRDKHETPAHIKKVAEAKYAALRNKPVPPTVIKSYNADRESIGQVNTINSELSRYSDQITAGKLDLGVMSNTVDAALNLSGRSTENSRNYASFRAGLERLRNDSLRLNTGVQTDGDADRAWKELIANINDRDVVNQRLKEIQRINLRGAALKEANLAIWVSQYPGLVPKQKPADISKKSDDDLWAIANGSGTNLTVDEID